MATTKLLAIVIAAVLLLHLPVPAAVAVKGAHNRTKDWGSPEYAHCVQPYSWGELVHGYKNSRVVFKVGGLGRLLEKGGYQTWQCFHDHYCATDASDAWFCFVYHETEKVFTPWGKNSKLNLVKSSETQTGCPHFNRTETGSICDIGLTRNTQGVCVPCETGKYKPAAGDEQCYPCESGRTTGPGLVPRSACLPAWLHVHEGNYYLNLNETVNWSEYYPSRTSWEKARFVKRPEPGDTSVLMYNDDYTFASWNGEYSVGQNFSATPWGIAMDCRCCGLESAFSFDLMSTPFQIEGSPSLNWCDDHCLSSAGPSGYNPHGSVTCGSTACTGSVGGMCGYGGLATSGVGSKSHFFSRHSNVITLFTSDGPLLGFHPGVLQNTDHLERVQRKNYLMCEKDIAAAGPCFNEEGTVAVCVCAAGYFSDAPGGTCKKCTVGSFCSTGGAVAGASIAPCPANSTSPAGSMTITNCTCNEGYTGPDGGPCAACEAGKYKEAVGSAACTQCPPGTLASPGSTEPAACVAPAPFFNASVVRYPSSYTYPAAYATRSLVPVPGYAGGNASFTGIDISSVISNDRKYWGGVLHSNGKIYYAPHSSNKVGEFDPLTRTFSVIDLPSPVSGGSYRYHGGVLTSNGMICFIPIGTTSNIGEFNPLTRTITVIDISAFISSDPNHYMGGVLGPNGIIYCIPSYADNVGEFNPVTRTFSVIDISSTISSDWKYAGGVLDPRGMIYFIPQNADNIGELNPVTRTFSVIDISSTISSDNKYVGGVLAPNGMIYFIPYFADNVGEFNPMSRTFSIIDISSTISSDRKYHGGVLGPNGKIYCIPFNANSIGVFDPSTKVFSTIDVSATTGTGNEKYVGGVVAGNGRVYLVPRSADNIGELDIGNTAPAYEVEGGVPEAWRALLSPHFNKL